MDYAVSSMAENQLQRKYKIFNFMGLNSNFVFTTWGGHSNRHNETRIRDAC